MKAHKKRAANGKHHTIKQIQSPQQPYVNISWPRPKTTPSKVRSATTRSNTLKFRWGKAWNDTESTIQIYRSRVNTNVALAESFVCKAWTANNSRSQNIDIKKSIRGISSSKRDIRSNRVLPTESFCYEECVLEIPSCYDSATVEASSQLASSSPPFRIKTTLKQSSKDSTATSLRTKHHGGRVKTASVPCVTKHSFDKSAGKTRFGGLRLSPCPKRDCKVDKTTQIVHQIQKSPFQKETVDKYSNQRSVSIPKLTRGRNSSMKYGEIVRNEIAVLGTKVSNSPTEQPVHQTHTTKDAQQVQKAKQSNGSYICSRCLKNGVFKAEYIPQRNDVNTKQASFFPKKYVQKTTIRQEVGLTTLLNYVETPPAPPSSPVTF